MFVTTSLLLIFTFLLVMILHNNDLALAMFSIMMIMNFRQYDVSIMMIGKA